MRTSLILRRAAKKPVSRPDMHMPAVTNTYEMLRKDFDSNSYEEIYQKVHFNK